MMRRTVSLIAALGLLLGLGLMDQAQAKDKKKVIAVGDASFSGACRFRTRTDPLTLSASLRTSLARTGKFRVVSRMQMRRALKEHEMEMTGLSDPETAKSLGKFVQADLLMQVDLLCMDDHIEMNVSLIDIETLEIAWATRYDMKDLSKTRKALNDITKQMKRYAATGEFPDEGAGDMFQIVDSKAFHDSCDYMARRIRSTIPRVDGEIEEVNFYAKTLKVKISYDERKPWAGLKLKVTDGDEDKGWIYLKDGKRGVVDAGTLEDLSSFEEGFKVSSQEFEPKVAIGSIEDVDEGVEGIDEKFRQRVYELFDQADGIQPAEGRKVEKILMRMGKRARKKDLAKLHKAGVDLLIVGRFLGESGRRRLDFEVLSTYDGKRVIDIKRDRIGL